MHISIKPKGRLKTPDYTRMRRLTCDSCHETHVRLEKESK